MENVMENIISILNKKGYNTNLYKVATYGKPFLLSSVIYELKEENLLIMTPEAKVKIKDIIKASDYESTIIMFKEQYNFDTLPDGFELNGTSLYYNLNVLKDGEEIEFKTLVELDEEIKESTTNLEKWVNDLLNNS